VVDLALEEVAEVQVGVRFDLNGPALILLDNQTSMLFNFLLYFKRFLHGRQEEHYTQMEPLLQITQNGEKGALEINIISFDFTY